MNNKQNMMLALFTLMGAVNSFATALSFISDLDSNPHGYSNDDFWYDTVSDTANGTCSTKPGCTKCVNAFFALIGLTSNPSCCSMFDHAIHGKTFTSSDAEYTALCLNDGFTNQSCESIPRFG